MTMADGLGVTPVYNLDGGNNNNNDGMFGGGGMWIFFLFFLLAWGGNGIGGFGGGNAATSQISNDFAYSELSSQIRDNSIQNQGILTGINQGLCNLGYENLSNTKDTQFAIMNGFNQTQAEMAQCCCTTQKELLVNRYEAEKNTCAITNAIHSEAEATRALINANEMQNLRDRLAAAELGLSNMTQTASIISQVRPFPIPAYPTCSPYSSPCATC